MGKYHTISSGVCAMHDHCPLQSMHVHNVHRYDSTGVHSNWPVIFCDKSIYLWTNLVEHTGGIVADLVGAWRGWWRPIKRNSKLTHSVHGAYLRECGSRTEPWTLTRSRSVRHLANWWVHTPAMWRGAVIGCFSLSYHYLKLIIMIDWSQTILIASPSIALQSALYCVGDRVTDRVERG